MKFNINNPIVLASIVATLGLAAARADMEVVHESDPHSPGNEVTLTMDQDVEVLLLRCGIDPVCLAAAGLPSNTVQSLLAAQQTHLELAVTQLAALDTACADTKRTMDALRRVVRSGLATDEEVAQLAQAKTAHEARSSQRDEFLGGVVASLTAELPQPAKVAIKNILASKDWKMIPMKFRVKKRSEAQWVKLRNALSAKRTHEKWGDEVPAQAAAHLSEMGGDQGVSQAKADCDACLSGVEGLWGQVFSADH